MPLCLNFFHFFNERNVVWHGQKDNGPTCFAKSCMCNNILFKFWPLDVLCQCGYFCFNYQILEWNMGVHAYCYGVVWNEWNDQVVHGFITSICVGDVWFATQSNCICKRWKH
jgi:hypothetical protein